MCEELLENLKQICRSNSTSKGELKFALEELLQWLVEPVNNTDENCRMVDVFITTQINPDLTATLPKEIQAILFDMGGALHDTHTAPQVARNFESTPGQLLERVSKL